MATNTDISEQTFRRMIGWYDDPTSERPAHEPGVINGLCLACQTPLSAPLRTISIRSLSGKVCYFFRVHCACDEVKNDDRAWVLIEQFRNDYSASATTKGATQ
jgi:hypothetical protein